MRAAMVAVVAVIALVGAGLLWGPLASPPETLQPLRIGVPPTEGSAPFHVADEQGFFAGNGLTVELRTIETGDRAIAAVEAGGLEFTTAAEYPLVAAAFDNRTVSAIGCIDRAQTTSVIGRRDGGIATVADLKGKRIGVTRRTIPEFQLGRLLDLNGMSIRDVTVVDVPSSAQREDAIANGSVDAVVTATREVVPITARLGANGVVFPATSDQRSYVLLVCDREWGAAHQQEAERLLRALASAEEYIAAHPAEAQAIAGRRTNLSEAYMAAAWPNHRFGLSLDRSLLTAMNDEARWMIRNNLTNATAVPDFTQYIDPAPLARVDPDAAGILGNPT